MVFDAQAQGVLHRNMGGLWGGGGVCMNKASISVSFPKLRIIPTPAPASDFGVKRVFEPLRTKPGSPTPYHAVAVL